MLNKCHLIRPKYPIRKVLIILFSPFSGKVDWSQVMASFISQESSDFLQEAIKSHQKLFIRENFSVKEHNVSALHILKRKNTAGRADRRFLQQSKHQEKRDAYDLIPTRI